MPEPTTPPATGAGTTPEAPAGTAAPAAPEAPKLQLTQTEIDAIVSDRLARERAKTGPELDELRRKAKEYDEAQAKGKSELELAQEGEKTAKTEAATALATANTRLRRAAIMAAAAEAGAIDPDEIATLLQGSEDVTVDKDGEVKGAKEAVAALLKAKPHHKKGATLPAASGGQFTGAPGGKSVDERIEEAQKAGNLTEVARLKQQKYAATAGT
jgi:hypothetical protein